MSAPANHWKLGAFVVGSLLIAATSVAVLGAQSMQTQTIIYKSYFDEAVTGLDVGSPVSFRGVKVGNVSAIDIAPDRRHVEISYGLGVKVLGRLGLAGNTQGKETRISVPDNLRVQIAASGLTGIKYLQIDFFDAQVMPTPNLPFPVTENYIPATASTMKNLEDAVIRGVDMLPMLTQDLGKLLGRVDLILGQVQESRLPAKAALTIDSAQHVLVTLQTKLDQLKVGELSAEASLALKNANVMLAKMNHTLERLDGDKGLVASVQRVTDSVGDVTGNGLDRNLRDTMRDLREAAVSIRRLVEALERDPDMLLKGKASK
jgi:paraquat-inducible protein B